MRFNGKKLKEVMVSQKLTLAVAESLTTGNVQAIIGSISGASNFFEGGITAYNIKQKVQQLDIDEAHAAEVDCVSQLIAIDMAKGVCSKFQSDIGIGTTGYAEPYPEQNVSEPYAYYAIWRRIDHTQNGEVVSSGRIDGEGLNREKMQKFVSGEVVSRLLSYLENS